MTHSARAVARVRQVKPFSTKLIEALLPHITHRHGAVRLQVLGALEELLLCGAGQSVETLTGWRLKNNVPIAEFYGKGAPRINYLADLSRDRSVPVRRKFVKVVARWIREMDGEDLYEQEVRIMPYLVSGLCDDDEETATSARLEIERREGRSDSDDDDDEDDPHSSMIGFFSSSSQGGGEALAPGWARRRRDSDPEDDDESDGYGEEGEDDVEYDNTPDALDVAEQAMRERRRGARERRRTARAREAVADRAEQPVGEPRVDAASAQRKRRAADARPRARRDRADRRPVDEEHRRIGVFKRQSACRGRGVG